ncbi:MAG: LLM class flavin-dependent oxidoreductase [Thermomicrobiales bacterium]|nr:LLM class flavin-dependent oxidoreductase [Thermomicrobiales bacterium]
MSRERPLRLGFFSYLQGDQPAPQLYEQTIEHFVAADAAGFHTAWVAQHHFGHHGGLPAPMVFFSALAERTRAIGLGTAIVALPHENIYRVAEDAAIIETLHPGRLQLGVGTGFSSDAVLAMFGTSPNRREVYDTGIDTLIRAFEGQPLNASGDCLYPPAPALRHRIWESPGSEERVAEAARRGSGLLLSRVAIGGAPHSTHPIQRKLVDRYYAELPAGVEPRIGMSRTVYPATNPARAERDLRDGLAASEEELAKQGRAVGLSIDELLSHYNIHYGSVDEVTTSLAQEPLIDEITDLICQVQPGLPAHEQILETIGLIASDVAPAIGWRNPTTNP